MSGLHYWIIDLNRKVFRFTVRDLPELKSLGLTNSSACYGAGREMGDNGCASFALRRHAYLSVGGLAFSNFHYYRFAESLLK